jgi:hypothetical protein
MSKKISTFSLLLWYYVAGCAVFDTASPNGVNNDSSNSGSTLDGSAADAAVSFDASRFDSNIPPFQDGALVSDVGLSDTEYSDHSVDVIVSDASSAADTGTTLDSATAQDAIVESSTAEGSTSDASTPDAAIPDASTPATDAAADTGASSCAGTRLFQQCWYLASSNVSCNQYCANHGGYDTDTKNYVGTPGQGGSLNNCHDILAALGKPSEVTQGTREDPGLGCHLWQNRDAWWLSSPSFDPNAAYADVSIVCACRN